MFSLPLCLIIGASFITIVTSLKEPGVCGKLCEGGVYDLCVKCPTPCPVTCENLNEPPRVCLALCLVTGCECAEGYVRDANKQCVLPSQCYGQEPPELPPLPPLPPICDKPCTGGIHDKCVSCGTRCPLTCDNLGSTRACTKDCVLNVCRCDEGYARAFDGRCVLPQNCPANTNSCRPKYEIL